MFAHLPEAIWIYSPLVGWSDSDSDFEKENGAKAINTKRLSLSFASDSKCFKRTKTKGIEGAKEPNSSVSTTETGYELGSESLPNLMGIA